MPIWRISRATVHRAIGMPRAQNLVGSAQLTVLTLKILDALLLGSRHARPGAGVDLVAADPLAQRLG
jgi:hypothetical protein